MHPDIRTYGRLRGRMPQTWPFALDNPPSWFIQASAHTPIILPPHEEIILEVGCGMGDSLWALCHDHPQIMFIGVEIYQPGLIKLAQRMHDNPLHNLLIIQGDILTVLPHIPHASLTRIHVFFPDPWPKVRHHKRRLHRGPFFERLQPTLQPSGRIHLATDIEEYALDWHKNTPSTWQLHPDDVWIAHRRNTKYEARGQRLGHTITDYVYSTHP